MVESMSREQMITSLSRLQKGEMETLCSLMNAPHSVLPTSTIMEQGLALLRWSEGRNLQDKFKTHLTNILSDKGSPLSTEPRATNTAPTTVHHHHGDTYMSGDNHSRSQNINVSGTVNGSINATMGDGAHIHNHHVMQAPVDAGETVDQEQFRSDVKEILNYLMDAVEDHDDKLTNAFMAIRKQEVQGKVLEDVQQMMEDVWLEKTGESMKTGLQKIDGTKVMETLLKSGLLAKLAKLVLG